MRLHQNEQKTSYPYSSPRIAIGIRQTTKPPHILHKLEYYNVNYKANIWIRSFMQKRKHSISLECTASMLASVLLDVPQLEDIFSYLYQRHSRNSNFIREKNICGWQPDAISTYQDQVESNLTQKKSNIHWRLGRNISKELHRRKCIVITITAQRNNSWYQQPNRAWVAQWVR